MPKMKITPVEEVNYGLYLWQMPDKSLVMDDEGGYLCIPATRGDILKIKKIKETAKHYGLDEGKPIFFSGHRMVTDEELEEQKSRAEMGLVPDSQDLPAMMEYIKEVRDMGLA
jgi:hypothetical protein